MCIEITWRACYNTDCRVPSPLQVSDSVVGGKHLHFLALLTLLVKGAHFGDHCSRTQEVRRSWVRISVCLWLPEQHSAQLQVLTSTQRSAVCP